MSERKNKVGYTAPKKNRADWGFNAVIVIVIAIVLGLGIYAVVSEYIKNHPQEEKTQTVADFIKDKELTLDEFKSEYGLADAEVNEDDAIESVSMGMSLENYAKYTDTSLEELKAEYKLGDDVAADTKWQDAVDFMPTGVVSEKFFGMDFDTFKTQTGLPETITADTLWNETNTVMNELYAQQETADTEENAEVTEENPEQDNNE